MAKKFVRPILTCIRSFAMPDGMSCGRQYEPNLQGYFRAIHEGKWLKIEYRNKADQVTKYWIGIRDLDPRSRTMKVDGLHLGQLTIGEYDRIFIDSILSTEIIEGTYCLKTRYLLKILRCIQSVTKIYLTAQQI